MAEYSAAGPRSPHEDEIVTESMLEFSELQSWRATFAGQWEEVAETVLPTSRNTFFYGNFNWPGQKKTDRQIDATAMMALHRFAAILDSLLTPRNQLWMQLTTQDTDLLKDRDVRLWYEQATRILFQQRYSAIGNFSAMNQQVYQSLGAFGTGGMFVDQAVNAWGKPIPQMRYKAIPLGELFIHENHQGVVDGCIRWFRLTARQALQKWGDKCPETIKAAAEKHSQMPFDFIHRICQRADYEYGRLDMKGKPYASYYISMQGRCLLEEGGYSSFPIAVTRYDQTPGEVYGRGPAMLVLPAIKTLNAMKTTSLKQAHRAADPVYLIADDGLLDPQFHPGAMNKGGWSMDGKPLVGTLPFGSFEIAKEAMAEEKSLILDAFLVQLFQILTETPTMTATEVIERTNEKGILLAPTVGRQQSEYLGPMTDREMDLLAGFGVLPPMPPRLKAARAERMHYNYTSPLARAQRAQEVAGFQRTIQSTLEVVKVTQDPSPFDVFDFDVATRDTAQIQAVPESWMASDRAIAAKRKARAQMQQQQAQIQAMPAQAAMMKAQTDRDAKNLTTNQFGPTSGAGQPSSPPQQAQQGPPQ